MWSLIGVGVVWCGVVCDGGVWCVEVGSVVWIVTYKFKHTKNQVRSHINKSYSENTHKQKHKSKN